MICLISKTNKAQDTATFKYHVSDGFTDKTTVFNDIAIIISMSATFFAF